MKQQEPRKPDSELRQLALFIIGVSVGICMTVMWWTGLGPYLRWLANH